MAEVVLETMAEGTALGTELLVESAGTGNWHVGNDMDDRARAALRRAGYDPDVHQARAYTGSWWDALGEHDLVVCLDRGHQQTIRSLTRGRMGDDRHEDRLVMLRAFDPASGGQVDVPDPYYGDDAGFDECLALIEAGCRGLIDSLLARQAG